MYYSIELSDKKNIFITICLAMASAFLIFLPHADAGNIADTATIKKWVSEGALIVDVRTPAEFASGNYKGSINIPLSEVEKNINRFGNKDQKIIVYCRSGNRSGIAKDILERHGYRFVLNGGALGNMP